jgi:hypothetical protein
MGTVEEGPREHGYGRAVALGIVVGVPAVFLLALLVALPGAGWPDALGVAAVPAIFGGPLFGGFALVLREVARWEREERPPVEATTGSEHRIAA